MRLAALILALVVAGAGGNGRLHDSLSRTGSESVSRQRVPVGDRVVVRLREGVEPAALLDVARGDVAVEGVVTEEPLRVVLRLRAAGPSVAETARRARGAAGANAVEARGRAAGPAGAGEPPSAVAIADRLRASGLVDYAVPEIWWPMELRSRHVPNDPLFDEQWPLENTGQGGRVGDADVDATAAWAYTRGSPDVVIAVLDDGVQLDHPDLAPNVRSRGLDFTVTPPAGDGRPRASGDRHGTSVAGVAAARGDNGLGISGMCPRCTILPLRVHKASNLATAAAFRYAVEQGADVIVNSWGYTREMPFAADDAVRDAIGDAALNGRGGRGALVVFAATNEAVDNCAGPHTDIASLESVVAVGVADHNDRIGGAGFGDCLDVVAPSKPRDRTTIGVMTTDRTGLAGHSAGEYDARFGGTSAAAPLVAGIAGLLLSLNPELTRHELQGILEHTADKIDPESAGYDARGFSRRAGWGRVNAGRALVPTVKIRVSPRRVRAGEPFSVSVSASAPFGLDTLSWFGLDTGIAALDEAHVEAAGGRAVHAVTWRGIVVDRPGVLTIGADATDRRYAAGGSSEPVGPRAHRPGDAAEPAVAYPHRPADGEAFAAPHPDRAADGQAPAAPYPHRAADAAGIATAVVTVVEDDTALR